MKKQLLRLSVLSMLCMLFGSTAWAGANDLLWDYTEKNIPTTSPDNGLFFSSYVNDAQGTNNSLHGVKLNSSGHAHFAKPAVAGTLTLVIGDRKKTSAYAVNVYTCTDADKATGAKGTLIGEVSVSESPGTGSIEIAADVTGIWIERKTGSEGVLCKIQFKETKARTFVDFEMTNAQLSGTFDASTLPAGVTFTGSPHNDNHGYQNATLTVPVDGTVKFTIGGCQYSNPATFTVKDANEKVLATLDAKTPGCYHNGGTITYIYTGEPTTLTFGPIPYLPYFKAEATEVQEATITYKDQNGNKLGEKKVFEGDPVGEIPYSEADLTIPEGYKFRGWVYASGVKVKSTDVVNGDVSINASVTAIETEPTVGSVQTYNLTDNTFYPEDHENFDIKDGSFNDSQHGFNFKANGSFAVKVAGNAQIALSLCQYGSGTTITVTDGKDNVISSEVPAKAATDGATTAINYTGDATTLTFTFASQTYLHKVTVFNVKEFVEKDAESGYYIVPVGDGASLVLALNSAATEANSKIFLPNGIYDLGESVQTPISGTNISIIGQSTDKVIIKNAPPIKLEGLRSAATLTNTSTGLYMQDITIQNELDYYNTGSAGRANALCENGDKTIAKNVRMLSYQDTYVTTTGKHFYWEDCEIHGTVDYICGGSDVFFERCLLVNESRAKNAKSGEATITAHQPKTEEKFGYVFNNCTIENKAATFNFGRAWGGATGATVRPMTTYLNTTLNQPTEIITTRFTLKGMNNQSGVFHEYNSMDVNSKVVSPATSIQTFTDKNEGDKATYETILTDEQAANYTMEKVLGDDFAALAKASTAQVEAPEATYDSGNVTWTPANNGATAYMILKNGTFAGITTGNTFAITIDTEKDALSIRAANGRGGFGEAKQVKGTATGIHAAKAATERGEQVIYNLAGQRVSKASQGLYIVNGKKMILK